MNKISCGFENLIAGGPAGGAVGGLDDDDEPFSAAPSLVDVSLRSHFSLKDISIGDEASDFNKSTALPNAGL